MSRTGRSPTTTSICPMQRPDRLLLRPSATAVLLYGGLYIRIPQQFVHRDEIVYDEAPLQITCGIGVTCGMIANGRHSSAPNAKMSRLTPNPARCPNVSM